MLCACRLHVSCGMFQLTAVDDDDRCLLRTYWVSAEDGFQLTAVDDDDRCWLYLDPRVCLYGFQLTAVDDDDRCRCIGQLLRGSKMFQLTAVDDDDRCPRPRVTRWPRSSFNSRPSMTTTDAPVRTQFCCHGAGFNSRPSMTTTDAQRRMEMVFAQSFQLTAVDDDDRCPIETSMALKRVCFNSRPSMTTTDATLPFACTIRINVSTHGRR